MSSPFKPSFSSALIFFIVALSAAVVAESAYFRLKNNYVLPIKLGTPEAHEMGKIHEITERNRRVLAGTSHISYDALNANKVPCGNRGQSYYNCGAAGRANPYQRGCSAVTRCARN
ncbi:hypothetical protein POM88_034777 [Heracleum sosnowskyi]|uniref:Rapid ALkalinization Factor n=1 Tax=Heracleum sosnowskyi TaxID=360622 RepID=A0AAD8MAV0_9APIA|nr:hypothetical protein POM88_034777 [Heracleum sosnowskyi]